MLEQMGIAAKAASYKLAQLSSREKPVLKKIADYLEAQTDAILRAPTWRISGGSLLH